MIRSLQQYYARRLACTPADEVWIRLEDINIEHIVTLMLTRCDAKNMKEAFLTCQYFIESLIHHKPRPTALRPVICSLTNGNPRHTSLAYSGIFRKSLREVLAIGRCLRRLGFLAWNIGQISEAEPFVEAKDVFVACGAAGREEARSCQVDIAEAHWEIFLLLKGLSLPGSKHLRFVSLKHKSIPILD